jgi:signal recognition particle receptor subunit beta
MTSPVGSSEVRFKIVLCGPPSVGKAAVLRHVAARLRPEGDHRLSELRTDDDRVLELEVGTPELPEVDGRSPRLLLCTAPGEVRRTTTWRRLVAGADALIFLADLRPERGIANADALKDLRADMAAEGVAEAAIPVVVAFRKVEGAAPPPEIRAPFASVGLPAFEVDVEEGRGVLAMVTAAVRLLYENRGGGLGDVAARRMAALAQPRPL